MRRWVGGLAIYLWAGWAVAGSSGRLLATAGASSIEGGSGGGLVPWAVIAGYGAEDQSGGSAYATRLETQDFALTSRGIAFGWSNRIELSLARQDFQIPRLADSLGLPDREFRQDVLGLKWRLSGDLVYGPGPQWALGLQHKFQRNFWVPGSVGAQDDRDIDLYLSAGKLWLDALGGRNVLVNATLRATRANQSGLLGFGGDRRPGRSLVGEVSAAWFLDRHWAVGAEYRQKPDNLSFSDEDDWSDVFIAWFPNKSVAMVVAWAQLGTIATLENQDGWYLSLQLSR